MTMACLAEVKKPRTRDNDKVMHLPRLLVIMP
jgi:hypothetical protein